MKKLIAEFSQHLDFKEIREHFRRGDQDLLTGISGSQKTLVISGFVWDDTLGGVNGKYLVVTYSNSQAYRIALDLESFLSPAEVAFFPSNELLPHEEAYEPEVTAQRIETLGRILQQDRLVVVTSWEALQRRLIPASKFLEFCIEIKLGLEYSLTRLIENLVKMGYERVDQVQSIGQFSQRGDLVDIFPLNQPHPIRMEFFGDEIDSIPQFQSGRSDFDRILRKRS